MVVRAASQSCGLAMARSSGGAPPSDNLMILVDDDCPTATFCQVSCRTRVSGALVTCPMEGVTGMMAGLGHVP